LVITAEVRPPEKLIANRSTIIVSTLCSCVQILHATQLSYA
jgi:hypothetical protein